MLASQHSVWLETHMNLSQNYIPLLCVVSLITPITWNTIHAYTSELGMISGSSHPSVWTHCSPQLQRPNGAERMLLTMCYKKVLQSIIPDSTFVTCLIVQMFTQFSRAGIVNALTKYLNLRKTLIHVPLLREAFKSFVTQNHQSPHVRNTITEQSACLEGCFLGLGE